MAEVKVICPHCKHIDHRGCPTASISTEKNMGFCFFCSKTIVGSDVGRAFRLTKVQGLHTVPEPEEVKSVSFQNYRWMPFHSTNGLMKDKALAYLERRKCKREYIEKYRFALGIGSLNGRIVMPVYDNHTLDYFQARTFINAEPKYYNPPKSALGKGKAEVVGYIDNLQSGKEIAICEGILSTIAVVENLMPAVAVFGHSISLGQLVTIVEKSPSKVYIIFDPDVTDYECRKEGQKFEKFGIPAEYYVPSGGDTWDIFEMGTGTLTHKRRR